MIVLGRLHPTIAVAALLALPEDGTRLEIVHDEFARGEGFPAVLGCNLDENNLRSGSQISDSVNDHHVEQRPALSGICHDGTDAALSHTRIMFEEETPHLIICCLLAHKPDKRGHGAHATTQALTERGILIRDREIVMLYTDSAIHRPNEDSASSSCHRRHEGNLVSRREDGQFLLQRLIDRQPHARVA